MRTSPAEFLDASMEVFYAVELEFDSGTVRLWNGTYDASIEGETYTGAGSLLSISEVEETGEIAARGANLSLSGIDNGFLSTALTEEYQNRPARVLFGVISGGVYSAYTIFEGRMDVMTITEGAETSTISLAIENRLIDLERPRSFRYTSEDQKQFYPNDKGLDYVADIQEKEVLWGKKSEG